MEANIEQTEKVLQPGCGKIYDSILETTGNTPLVRINRMVPEARANVLAKLEFFNPAASVKDRIAVAMLDALDMEGALGTDAVIVEPTAGNTGIGLAAACAARGLRCILVMPDGFSKEREKLMRFLGAEVTLTPATQGIGGAIEHAMELVALTPGAIMPWQYGNPANAECHRCTTAEEIWNDTSGQVDAVVLGVGTGGTLTGIGEALKSKKPSIKIVAVEPALSAVLSGGRAFPHDIQGIGTGFIPEILNVDIIDEVMTIREADAIQTARDLARLEGIPAGISSGAALHCALELATRPEMLGGTIVTIFPSQAERYMSTALFDDI
ncbi:MAG: cysteine synthase A [Roseobacter sp.]